ncbi:3-phosphoshikimate 1-carboxyvinyltransferase [Methanothermobacter sp. THM-1]|uniref:3-phosphoshikimate 1-carboxyvinyltransferase n=1 Tax=Methanothermobacter sp. THM-1 TaxID=2606911 RepID=UPI0013669966|nr:3-phosphoshikimate 1-carboxyvinyltransferase [Methanothermobacter sp. THM-1]QHN07235.1 3-phosphoshikimate 1-carboxyvinyltransferase [Methanothermobacter sp. THM-1]
MDLIVERSEGLSGTVKAPPSKSYTHRAVIVASLAEGRSMIADPLVSEDTLSSLRACRAFGVRIHEEAQGWMVHGSGGALETPEDVIDVGNSGTTLRIMTSVAGLAENYTVFTGDESLRKRPMQPLLDALRPLGVTAVSSRMNGLPPIIVRGGFRGGETSIDGRVSSQFISSILIAAPLSGGVELSVEGEFISRPYVDMTLDVMGRFSVPVSYSDGIFTVEPSVYRAVDYTVEGDYSSASYLAGAAAVAGGEVRIQNLFRDSKQGDMLILDILEDMGADVRRGDDHAVVSSTGELEGVSVDLHNAPDLLPTVAVLGAIAEGRTEIRGVEHARYKETDRIGTCAAELKALGLQVRELKDGMIIQGDITGKTVKSHGDHRLAMAFTLIGLRRGIRIKDGDVFSVSFPDFIEKMNSLGCRLRLAEL